MKPSICVRPLTDDERTWLEAGLRSPSSFVLRRCQILLASARGERPPQIARSLGCNDQTVRNVIGKFTQQGIVACLTRQSQRPHRPAIKLDGVAAERLRALLHQSPRSFGQPSSLWTLERAAEVSFAQGITRERVSDETIRHALQRLGVSWKRAKHWITSPDPEYARKKGPAIV
jgi:transposase